MQKTVSLLKVRHEVIAGEMRVERGKQCVEMIRTRSSHSRQQMA